jgi:hypothetical protein
VTDKIVCGSLFRGGVFLRNHFGESLDLWALGEILEHLKVEVN